MNRIVAPLTLLASIALTACGSTPGDVAADPDVLVTSSDETVEELVSIGDVPERVDGKPDVELLTCEREGDVMRIEAAVTNNTAFPALLQGVDVTLRAGDRVIEDADETSGLWSSITIGPGRQLFLAGEEDLPADPPRSRAITCELGEPDMRDNAHPSVGRRLDPQLVTMRGCDEGAPLEVENPTDRPIGVYVVVEFFDDRGFSAGQMEMGQAPTRYTDGRPQGPFEVALEPGGTGTYPVMINDRIDRYRTPMTGPVTSCEVLTARYVVDPDTSEVIVN